MFPIDEGLARSFRPMLRGFVLVCLALVLATEVRAACPVTVLPNNGATSTSARAPMLRFRFERSVYLITATEMSAAGFTNGSVVEAIGWTYSTGNGASGNAPLVIYMQNTTDVTNTKSTTWATAISGMTIVHNATTTLPAAAGPVDVTFSGGSPFTYTGAGVYIAFDFGQYAGTLSTTTVISCNNSLANGLLGAQSTSSAPTTLTASASRPETRLTPAGQYTIVATAGSGGSISPAGSVMVNCGDDPAFTITPDPGFSVADVVVDGSSVGAVTLFTFTDVSANHTIHATFSGGAASVAELQVGRSDGLAVYPNPAGGDGAHVLYRLAAAHAAIDVAIYEVSGRLVRSLASGAASEGMHTVDWNGRDESGAPVAAGVYMVRLRSADGTGLCERLVIRK